MRARATAIVPLVRLLVYGTDPSKQMSAQILAAIGAVPTNRDTIVDADAVKPLVRLLTSTQLGTPEASARALHSLVRGDGEDENKSQGLHQTRGVLFRHSSIDHAGGTKWLIAMLDGSNLTKGESLLKPPAVGGWPSLMVGVAGCHETEEMFPGSNGVNSRRPR